MKTVIPLLGRILLSAIFLLSGIGKIQAFPGTLQYMAAHGMPYTRFLLVCAIIIEIGGGLSLLLGYKVKWGAFALVVFLIPATMVFHTHFADQGQMIHFMKNLAIMGGLLMAIYSGPGSFSIDRRAG